MARVNKLKTLTSAYRQAIGIGGFNLEEENIDFFGIRADYDACTTRAEVQALVPSFVEDYICGSDQIQAYINEHYPDFNIRPTTLKNVLAYSYLRDNHTIAGKTRIVRKSAIDSMFSDNIVTLDAYDYYHALNFALDMLTKVEDVNPRFGTFYDKIAHRNGSVLNYIERHVIGKLGELAASKLISNRMNALNLGFTVENSFNLDQVEAADLVQLKDRNNVIVGANRRIQIKTAFGLNSVVLKEDSSKLDSDTFNVDYCMFVQLLNTPFAILLSLLRGISDQFIADGTIDINNNLCMTPLDNGLLNISAKVSGYIGVSDMIYIAEGADIKPLGAAAGNSYYAYVADLQDDFDVLARDLVPARVITRPRR